MADARHVTECRSGLGILKEGRRPGPRGGAIALAVATVAGSLFNPADATGVTLQYSQGERRALAAEVGLLLRRADGVKRVMMVGAHPDDEDTSLLAHLSLTRGADVTYVSLTRGEGGQNRIGTETGEELGVLRTGELLAARRIDGARQAFTRAVDFGYSRSAEETLRIWPADSVLADLVALIRERRPQVLISIFSGTNADGHGHHQAAGILTRRAFAAAGRADRFPGQQREGLEPWSPTRLYIHNRRDPSGATAVVATGDIDPLLGRSPHQVAMRSRSQHRSQAFGTVGEPGPHVSRLHRVHPPAPDSVVASLFATVDTSLAALGRRIDAGMRPNFTTAINAYRTALGRARSSLHALAPQATVQPLLDALVALKTAAAATEGPLGRSSPNALVRDALRERLRLIDQALLAATGVRIGFRSSDGVVVPGQRIRLRLTVWNGGLRPIRVDTTGLRFAGEWDVRPYGGEEPFPGDPGPFGGTRSGPADAPAAEPDASGARLPPGALYELDYWARVPFDTPPASGHGRRVDGLAVRVPIHLLDVDPDEAFDGRATLRHRTLDRTRGESWSPVIAAPGASLRAAPELQLLPENRPGETTVRVAVRVLDPRGVTGTLRLEVPEGWSSRPTSVGVRLGEGRETSYAFRVTAPAVRAMPRTVELRPVLTTPAGHVWSEEFKVVAHEHIEPRGWTRSAKTRVVRLAIEIPERRVAYVARPNDATPRALRRLGIGAEPLEPDDWTEQRLATYDVIVLGVRAYETRPDLRVANETLLDWVRRGGTLIVQYNRYDLLGRHYAPFPLDVSRPPVRVTDETAPVELLAPEHPALRHPNEIGPADFENWVQERSTFMPREWDERYRPLLSMHDPGHPDTDGGLLVADVGEGVYVHVTLSLFRQLREGVPGAYRLLANLLAL